MATTLSVTEAVRNFSECINRVVYKREKFVLRKGKKIVAELRPVLEGRSLRELPAVLGALPRLSAEEAESFAHDLTEIRAGIAGEGVRDPWAS